MTKATSSKAATKKATANKQPAEKPAQKIDEEGAIKPSFFIPKSFLPALMIIGSIVAIAAMLQSSRGLDNYPPAQTSPSTAAKVESVLASTSTLQDQNETPAANISSEPADTTLPSTPIKQTAVAHTPLPPQTAQPAAASQTPPVQSIPPVTTTTPPAQPDNNPPAGNPPVSSPPSSVVPAPKPKPQHNNGLLKVVNDLLSTLL